MRGELKIPIYIQGEKHWECSRCRGLVHHTQFYLIKAKKTPDYCKSCKQEINRIEKPLVLASPECELFYQLTIEELGL